MAIRIDYSVAKKTLGSAVNLARGGGNLPVEWVSHARTVYGLASKTYTPALASLLLAKATDDRVDTLSIKVVGERSYSLRGIGHSVVVPGAVEYGFSVRATGREPLNNQPWFRYNRIDEFERVKARGDYEYFLDVARRANDLTASEALAALAAFIFVATEEANKSKAISVKVTWLSADGARIAAEDFLRFDAPDRPQRLQAFAAACLDLAHGEVRSRRINDPSRDSPGDVHVHVGSSLIAAVEVRGKPVPPTELDAFVDACAKAGIARAILFVDAQAHAPIEPDSLSAHALMTGAVQVTIYESAAELVLDALAWSDRPLDEATAGLAAQVLARLREIEVPTGTLEEWVRAVAVAQAR